MLKISAGSSPVLPNQSGNLRVEFGDLAGPEQPVLVAENQTHEARYRCQRVDGC